MPALRDLLALQRDRLGLLTELAARGDAARLALPGLDVVLLSDPATGRSVLTTHQRSFAKSPVLRQARVVLGEGLLTAEGEVHRRHRRLVQPAFHHRRLAAYAREMTAAVRDEVAGWDDGALVDAGAAVHRIALQITGRTLFGTETRAQAEAVRGAVDDVLAAYPTALLPFGDVVRRLPLPPVRRLHRGLDRIDALVAELIAQRRHGGDPGDDLLGLLLAARDEQGVGLDDIEVRDEVVTLLLAGHETTAAMLTWACHLLARWPEVQRELHAEVDGLGRVPTASDLAGMHRTRATIAEALRLYPPSYAIARQAIRDVALKGVAVAAGDVVVVSPWVLHRDPRWWVQADRFAPERWRGVDPARPHRAYLPFGAGSRICAGEAFAWMEGVAVLATVLRDWRLEPTGALPRPQASLTLRPGPAAPLRVRRRRSPDSSGLPGFGVRGSPP